MLTQNLPSKPTWTTALPNWQEKIVKGESLIPCQPLFTMPSKIALRVFKELTLVDVLGCPKISEVTKEWVFEFVAVIFGAYDPVSKKRLIKEFFLLISKKTQNQRLLLALC